MLVGHVFGVETQTTLTATASGSARGRADRR